MLKRKLYILSIGAVLAHLSMATTWQGGDKLRSFGITENCATCARQASESINPPMGKTSLPLNENILEKITGFGNGNAVGQQSLSQAMSAYTQQAQLPPQAQRFEFFNALTPNLRTQYIDYSRLYSPAPYLSTYSALKTYML